MNDFISFTQDINEDSKGFYLVENILLRPSDLTSIEVDTYSNRLTFIFPNWCSYFWGSTNQSVLQHLILDNLPAHHSAEILLVSPSQMASFETVYWQWTKDVKNEEKKRLLMKNIRDLVLLQK